jgi:hypothetical protein
MTVIVLQLQINFIYKLQVFVLNMKNLIIISKLLFATLFSLIFRFNFQHILIKTFLTYYPWFLKYVILPIITILPIQVQLYLIHNAQWPIIIMPFLFLYILVSSALLFIGFIELSLTVHVQYCFIAQSLLNHLLTLEKQVFVFHCCLVNAHILLLYIFNHSDIPLLPTHIINWKIIIEVFSVFFIRLILIKEYIWMNASIHWWQYWRFFIRQLQYFQWSYFPVVIAFTVFHWIDIP